MKEVLNKIEYQGEEVLLVRNKKDLLNLFPRIQVVLPWKSSRKFIELYRTMQLKPGLVKPDWRTLIKRFENHGMSSGYLYLDRY